MSRMLQALPVWQRRLIFFAILALIIALFVGLTLYLAVQSLRTRTEASVLADVQHVSVREFAVLPGEAAYPAALAISADGTLYTGSYADGTIWRITPAGDVQAVPDTLENIGSVSGLTLANGALYVLDRIEPLSAEGAILWRISNDGFGQLERLRDFDPSGDAGLVLPDDIAADANGKLYITDRGPDRVWRYDSNGHNGVIWWETPNLAVADQYAPTGIAYDPTRAAMLITDPLVNLIYAVPVATEDTQAATQTLYQHTGDDPLPGFDGLTVAPDGTIYVTALARNRVARLQVGDAADSDNDAEASNGQLQYLAQGFRSSSDLAYDAGRDRLYVSNWDQRWLLPVNVLLFNFYVPPRTPFALDVLEFSG